jgi:STELLO glycosyltransferases
MNDSTFLVITSIAAPNAVLKDCAGQSKQHGVNFVVMGDTKSPAQFDLDGCDFWSIDRQLTLPFSLVKDLPVRHYGRKNLGYLVAMQQGAQVIIETDDDNFPRADFWENRERTQPAHNLTQTGWTNVYKYFTDKYIWPRGYALEHLHDPLPALPGLSEVRCPIQQGLADENPDVDAIYRLTLPLPLSFEQRDSVALGDGAWCAFNSQNTTFFAEAFPLLYLPSHCSFRMTDIWRSYVAQRVAWTCGWSILFHNATVWQERNEHNLMRDFEDEISGYTQNRQICLDLAALDLPSGVENIHQNLLTCYQMLTGKGYVGKAEMPLVEAWVADVRQLGF